MALLIAVIAKGWGLGLAEKVFVFHRLRLSMPEDGSRPGQIRIFCRHGLSDSLVKLIHGVKFMSPTKGGYGLLINKEF